MKMFYSKVRKKKCFSTGFLRFWSVVFLGTTTPGARCKAEKGEEPPGALKIDKKALRKVQASPQTRGLDCAPHLPMRNAACAFVRDSMLLPVR